MVPNGVKAGSGPGSMQPHAFWSSLLQPLLQPVPEPLAFCRDAGAVEDCGVADAEATGSVVLLPMELWVAEAG
jgi:hypothetical protein